MFLCPFMLNVNDLAKSLNHWGGWGKKKKTFEWMVKFTFRGHQGVLLRHRLFSHFVNVEKCNSQCAFLETVKCPTEFLFQPVLCTWTFILSWNLWYLLSQRIRQKLESRRYHPAMSLWSTNEAAQCHASGYTSWHPSLPWQQWALYYSKLNSRCFCSSHPVSTISHVRLSNVHPS